MDGPQDVGGRMGFGPLPLEANEPIFHGDWERRVLGLTLACGALGHWTLDESRHARESLPPDIYYSASYYEIWLRALEQLLINHGEVAPNELADGHMCQPGIRVGRRADSDRLMGLVARGGPTERTAEVLPKFAVGDRVHTLNTHPETHTRLPSYARDKVGIVEAWRGAHVFPDSNAHGLGEDPQHLYTIAFDGQTLWGPDSDASLTVTVDAWEPYLERA